jgi:hypothetical protein
MTPQSVSPSPDSTLPHAVTIWLIFSGLVAAVATTLLVGRSPTSNPAVVRRLRHRVGVAAGAVVLWPVLLYAILGTEPFTAPISVTVCVVVMLYLSFEVAPLSVYKGPVSEYDNSDAVYERGVQVSTVAFAVATLLLSQKDDGLATLVAAPIFLSLLFCTISAVPSAVARRRVGAWAHWNALQKVAVSFAAGLLCLSVACCLDELRSTQRLGVPLSRDGAGPAVSGAPSFKFDSKRKA